MAKYFRSRQGGNFKQRDGSNLGLQAYKDQQAAQITAEKENLQTLLQFRKSQERGLVDAGQNELWNFDQLDNLENKIHANKIRATTVAKETELKKISDQAKIYGDEAKWLQEWAPKFYGNVLKAGMAGVELYDKWQSDKKFQDLLEDPKFEESINILSGVEGQARKDIIAAKNKAYSDKDIKAVEYLDGLLKNSSGRLSEKIADHLIDRFDALEADLERFIRSDEGAGTGGWKAENVVEFYKMRSRELIKQFGLTGGGATKLLKHFSLKGALKSSELADEDKLISDEKARFEKKDDIISKIGQGADLRLAINDAIITYQNNSYRAGDERTGILKGFPNPRAALELLFEDVALSGKISDLEQLKNDFLDSCTPGSMKGNTCVTYRQRFPKTSEGSLYSNLDEIIVRTGKKLAQKSDDKRKGDDGFALNDWNARISGTGIYAPGGEKENEALTSIDTEDKVEMAFTAYREAKTNGNTKTMDAIGKVLFINPRSTTREAVIEGLWRESIQGDEDGAAFYWLQLSDTERQDERLIKLYKPVQRVQAAGYNKKSIKARLEGDIKEHSHSVNLLGGNTISESGKRLLPHYEQRFYFHLNDLEASGKFGPNESLTMVNTALSLARKDLKSNEGIFKIKDYDGDIGGIAAAKTVFSFFDDTDSPEPEWDNIREQLKVTGGNLLGDDGLPIKGLIHPESLKNSVIHIQRGQPVTLPDGVHIAYELRNKSLSKTEFVNKLLEQGGFSKSLYLKPNANDIVDLKVNKLWGSRGVTLRTRGTDRVTLDLYTNIINQEKQAKQFYEGVEFDGKGGVPGEHLGATPLGETSDGFYNFPIPMPNLYRYKDLQQALQKEYPNLDLSDISVNSAGVVSVNSDESYKILLKNKAKLGLKFKANASGGFDLVSESNQLWRVQQIGRDLDELEEKIDNQIKTIETILEDK